MLKFVCHTYRRVGCSLLSQMSARYIFISTFWPHFSFDIFRQFIFVSVWYVMTGCNLAVATNSTNLGECQCCGLCWEQAKRDPFLAVNFLCPACCFLSCRCALRCPPKLTGCFHKFKTLLSLINKIMKHVTVWL